MSIQEISGIVISVLGAIGLRELIVIIIKRKYKKQDLLKTSEENERKLNRDLMNSMLNDVKKEVSLLKEEIKERGRIEIEYREKFSHCKAQQIGRAHV